MVKRFRMIAGPNGSGKSTLVRQLRDNYAVNFYDFLNADDILAALQTSGAYSPKFPVSKDELMAYADASTYEAAVRDVFHSSAVSVDEDCIRFDATAINSYTVALLTNFLQDAAIRRGESFSQETVFSHRSKIDALRHARECGYRTYLYFVATGAPSINANRVANRVKQGGHHVPLDKITSRYVRSLKQVHLAIPYLSRAYFFDNSDSEMTYLGQYSQNAGFTLNLPVESMPTWFTTLHL